MYNSRINENVRYLAKAKGIKLGYIEKELGVSLGYFSRGNQTNINAARLYQVSKILGESMEDLIEKDFRREIIQDKIAELKRELKEIEDEAKKEKE